MDVGVEVQKLARRLDVSDGSRGDAGTVEVGADVELQGSPGATGPLYQELSVVAEEDTRDEGVGDDVLLERSVDPS